MAYEFETSCLHGKIEEHDEAHYGALSYPIYQTATFSHKSLGESSGYDYSRLQNPTRQHLEEVMSVLESAYDTIAFSSGMAAISVIMELFAPGSHIIASEDLYGGTTRFFEKINRKNGYDFTYVDTSDIEQIEAALRENTAAVFVETPTNPMMYVTDLRKTAELTRKHGLLLIVDNTFLSPYFQKPLLLGADIVVESGTKFLCGHNDTLAGFLSVKDQELSEKLRYLFKTTGAGLAPFDSWLLLRGIKTLPLRMERQQENAFLVVKWLQAQKEIEQVAYIGLETHPSYSVHKGQSTGFGSMISFRVDSEETAGRLLNGVKLIRFAESLGGVESLITYPVTQTHADLPIEERLKRGIDYRLLRLSVGIENEKDLIEDLEQALHA